MAPLFGGKDDRSAERSAAERAAARAERERRRAQRAGEDVPPAPADDAVAPIEAPPAEPVPADDASPAGDASPIQDARASWSVAGDAPAQDDPTASRSVPDDAPAENDPAASAFGSEAGTAATAFGEPREVAPFEAAPDASSAFGGDGPDRASRADEPEADRKLVAHPEPGADPEADRERGEPGTTATRRRTVSLPRPLSADDEHGVTESWERPIGTVRVARTAYETQPGAGGVPPHRSLGVPRHRRRRGRRRVLALIVLVVIAAAILTFVNRLYQPFHGDPGAVVNVTVPAGASAGDIGDLLEERGVVASGFFFSLRARLSGQREELRSGAYRLRADMSYAAALDALTTPPTSAPVLKVTLPEGPGRRELVARVRDAGLTGSYVAATRRSSVLRPRDYGAPRDATLEGFLFPATYELRRNNATAKQLVGLQLAAFKDNLAQVDLEAAKRKNLTRYDVVIIASMIEREALTTKDRRLISAVIYNRLKQGMTLGIDATLRYRLSNWSRPLRQSELALDSAFNTRKRQGLPPSPIGNPGLASLKAAANPAKVPYLFYVVKPCGNGAHAFSSTDAQFQKDVAAYNKARDENGGNDPSRC